MTTPARHPSGRAARCVELPATAQPRPRKLRPLLTLGSYPIVTTLRTVADPILRHLTRREKFALVGPMLVWVVIPFLYLRLGGWMAR